jgi:hypothetical protein
VRQDAGTGVNALVKSNPDLDPELQRAQIEATMPVFFPADKDRPFGFQEPREWQRYAQWMTDNRLLVTTQTAQRAFTNEFLPGEGI